MQDILIIGGGINGTGIALDAAGRGLKVTLCEMNDIASATSSASSKLIHGGLRYLENFEFSLVTESLRERSLILQNAPHLVHPQAFVLPHCPWLRPKWMIKTGLYLYDFLAYKNTLPRSETLTTNIISELGLKSDFKQAFRYYDCAIDDSRLCLHIALFAEQKGAKIIPRTKLINTIRHKNYWDITLQNTVTKHINHIQAKIIINTAGPWAEQVAKNHLNINTKHKIRLVKGSHIIVPRIFNHDNAFILQQQDNRVIFVTPFQKKFHLIGTTEITLDNIPENLQISCNEIEYLCSSVNNFIKQPILKTNILHTFAGIRALQHDNKKTSSKTTRDFALELTTENNLAPALSVFGGKITTYRSLAEKVVNKLKLLFPNMGRAWTKNAKLPGGDIPTKDITEYLNIFQKKHPFLTNNLSSHLVHNYGTRAEIIVSETKSIADLGQKFSEILYQKEVDFLVQEEWVNCAEDILWRRGKLGLFLSTAEKNKLSAYLDHKT